MVREAPGALLKALTAGAAVICALAMAFTVPVRTDPAPVATVPEVGPEVAHAATLASRPSAAAKPAKDECSAGSAAKVLFSGPVEGTVRDSMGAPIGGVLLRSDLTKWIPGALGTARSDAAGRFSLPTPLVPGGEPPPVEAWATGFVPWTGKFANTADGIARMDIMLHRGVALTVRVVDGDTGLPIEDAEIGNLAAPDENARTDVLGTVLLPIDAGETRVRAKARHHGEASADIVLGADPSRASVEIRLPPFVTFTGTVLDETGAPLEGAEVFALDGEQTTSDAEGQFSVEGPPFVEVDFYCAVGDGDRSVTSVYACVLAARLGERTPAIVRLDVGKRSGAELRLGAPSIFTGTVVDPAGAPLPSVRVYWRTDRGTGFRELGEILRPGEGWTAETDARGRFRLAGLPAESGYLSVSPSGRGALWQQVRSVTLGPGKRQDVQLVVDAASTLCGRVVDSEGVAVVGAQVFFTQECHAFYVSGESVTDAAGRFTISGVPNEAQKVDILMHGFRREDHAIDPRAPDTMILLGKP